jgi:hypothetical protein
MLFRNKDGTLIEINKLDYVNDVEYYKQVCSCYGIDFVYEHHNTLETIISLSKKGMNNNSNQYDNADRKYVTKNHNISNARF